MKDDLTEDFVKLDAVTTQGESESDFVAPNSARAFVEAAAHNLRITTPGSADLQIDIDSAEAFDTYKSHKEILNKFWVILQEVIADSKSGKPWRKHITVTLKNPITPLERIALQACLGSDRKRELLSLEQLKNNDPHSTLFLEKK